MRETVRWLLITYNNVFRNIDTQATEEHCELRSPALHDQHCEEMEADSSKSKEYGVNSNSILNDLQYFHVCSGALVPDIMHDILEGALQYEAKLILKKFIQEDKYFTLDELNSILECFEFGYAEGKTRPTPITSVTLSSSDNSLKQNGKCYK